MFEHLGIKGEVKRLNPVTMENIADAALEEGLTLPISGRGNGDGGTI
jgi:hypothetical protein